MNLTRIIFLALAVVLPTSWTVAHAADEAPAAEGAPKKEKKAKKGKKADAPAEGAAKDEAKK